MRKKVLLFDLDGTLVSTGGAGLRALDRACQNLFDISGVMKSINPSGKTDHAIFREIIHVFLKRDMSENDKSSLEEKYLAFLEDEMTKATKLTVLEGVQNALGVLAQMPHYLIGLGTGNLEKGAQLKLAPTGLLKYFSFGGYGSDAERRSLVLKTGHKRAEKIAQQKISEEDVVIIGDTPLDIKAAREAGYKAIGVSTGGYSIEELSHHKPDLVLKNLGEQERFLAYLA